jgi:protein-disulfide isomerase
MKKKNKIALGILIGGVMMAGAVYAVLRIYFYYNPIIICGSDKYSTGCLVSYASSLNLNKRNFINCMTDNSNNPVLKEDADAATVLNISVAPMIFAGQLTDNTDYTGFYIASATYDELKTISDNLINKGVDYAQSENLQAVKAKTADSVKQYLESQGYTGTVYNDQLAKLQPSIDSYYKSFDMFNIKMKINTVLGNKNSKYALLYFVDYGGQYNSEFYSTLLSPEITDYVNTNKLALVVNELPTQNSVGDSMQLSNAALCAGVQNKYFEYSQILNTL